MRVHEAALCLAATFAPMASLLIWFAWWTPFVTVLFFSLPMVRLVGWMIDAR